jgi:hypothetical protein
MTDTYSADELSHSADEAAEIKARDITDAVTWRANLWDDVPAAISYANAPPQNGPGVIFNIRDNGQVWTYDLH